MCKDVRMIEVWFVMCSLLSQSFYLRSMSINKHLGLTKSTRIISCFSLLQYNTNNNHSQSNRRAVNRPNELQHVDSKLPFHHYDMFHCPIHLKEHCRQINLCFRWFVLRFLGQSQYFSEILSYQSLVSCTAGLYIHTCIIIIHPGN